MDHTCGYPVKKIAKAPNIIVSRRCFFCVPVKFSCNAPVIISSPEKLSGLFACRFLFCVLNACLFCCMYVITRYLIMQYKFISFLFFSFLSKSSLYFFIYYSQWRYFRHACARNCFSLESLFFLICTRYVSFFGAKKHAFQAGVLFRSSYFFSALSVHSLKTVPLKIIIFGYF